MKKMLIIMVGLLALSLLVVGCGTGKAVRTGSTQCNLKKNCDEMATLNAKVTALESEVNELKSGLSNLQEGETSEEFQTCVAEQTGCGLETFGGSLETLGEPVPFGGCPRGTTASSCSDATHVFCTGSAEFGDATIDCAFGDSTSQQSVCTGEAPAARCSSTANTG